MQLTGFFFLPVQIKTWREQSTRNRSVCWNPLFLCFPTPKFKWQQERIWLYTFPRNEIKIERRVGLDQWVIYLVGDWGGGDIKRFKQASKRNNEKWNKTGRGCCTIKFVRRLKKKERKREREKYYLLLILCQVRLPMWLQPVPVCGEYHSFLSRESAIDGPENLFFFFVSRPFVWHSSISASRWGPSSAIRSGKKGKTFSFADAFCSDSITGAHRNIHHQFPVCLILSLSLFFQIFYPFPYLSSSFFFVCVNPLISFFRTHSATVCNQRVSSIHGATEDEAAYHFKVAYTISSHSFFFFFMKHAQG